MASRNDHYRPLIYMKNAVYKFRVIMGTCVRKLNTCTTSTRKIYLSVFYKLKLGKKYYICVVP
jgi:hypothetical protein